MNASYAGDASYKPSAGAVTFTVAKATTSAQASVSGSTVQYGLSTQIIGGIATTSNGVAPTGTVQFYVDGIGVGGAVLIGTGSGYDPTKNPPYAQANATTNLAFTAVGNRTLTAAYSGDGNYAASTSPALSVLVGQGATSFSSWGPSMPNPVVGQSLSLIAQLTTAGSGGVPPTGAVTFYVDDVALMGTVSYTPSSNGLSATIPYMFTSSGNHNLKVSYFGDANYQPTTSTEGQTTVAGAVSLTTGSQAAVGAPGQSGSMNFTIVPNGGYTGPATVACTPDPAAAESTCAVTVGTTSSSSVQVNLTGASLAASVTVATTARHTARNDAPSLFGTAGRIVLAGFVLLMAPVIRRRGRALLGMMMLALALGIVGCGGGSSKAPWQDNSDPGTAAGTYTFKLVATPRAGQYAGSTTVPFTVVVQ